MKTVLILIALTVPAMAQVHQHPGEIIPGLTGKFYETWDRPDRPGESCCKKSDCYATEAHMSKGTWLARRREDGAWLSVPSSKVERKRDSPDGLSHLCAPPPLGATNYEGGVICFIVGGGT